jgi:hypothetical protein
MRTNKLLAGTLTLALSAASLAAQNDTTPLPAPASAYSIVSSDIRVESDVYFLNGTGPFGTWIKPLDEDIDRSVYYLSHLFSSDSSAYVPGETLKAANPSGTLYGYNVGYDFKLARVPGSFTVETSYRSGVLRDDSGSIPFDSSFTIQFDDDTPFTIHYSGDVIRTVDLHESDLSFLTLWHPAGHLGDWLAAGFEYSHGEYDCDFVVRARVNVSATGEQSAVQTTEAHTLNDIKIDDYLLHVRLGSRPLVVFAQGKCGIKARADIAAGYSTRDDYVTDTTHTTSTEDGVTSTEDSSHGQKGSLSDTLIFKGSASLSFYYKTGPNTFEAGAGFVCESDFGPDSSGETKGLMARLGYTRAW